jgi:hypothetical protein
MVDVNTQNKTISVNVSSSGVSSNVNASGDTAMYYSNKSKEYATSDKLIDGKYRSSKYYSEQAQQSALNAQSFAQSTQDSYKQFQDSVDGALNNIDSSAQTAITTIDTKSNEAIENIGIETNKQIANIERTGFYMRDDKLYFINSNGEEEEFKSGGGGLEIGDIGIAPLGIDETQGKRRYLNGQVIIQDQYIEFTNKVKSAQTLYPNLFATEEQWQATVTMSAYGACYKFVVDDTAGTIRLPKITGFIQGLTDLASLGDLVEAGLPNITATLTTKYRGAFNTASGAISVSNSQQDYAGGGNNSAYMNASFNASRSSSVYKDGVTTVQPESGRYPYFIQVATGAETEDNITNTIELNNPFFFGMSQYFETEPNNLSWLKSNGQWNSKAVYTDYYDWLLREYNNPNTINVNVSGSPTVNDGVYSGFSESSYLTLPSQFTSTSQPWEIVTPVKVNAFSTSAVEYFLGSNNYSICTCVTSGKTLMLFLASADGSWNIANSITSTLTVELDTQYYIKTAWTGTQYIVSVSTDKETYTPYITVNSTTPIQPTTLKLGTSRANTNAGTNLEIDIKEAELISNGSVWWKGLSSKVKMSTEAYTDYDFVLNTTEETFRLPLLDGSENIISGRYDDLGVDTSKAEWNFVAPANGFVSASVQFTNQSTYLQIRNATKNYHYQTPSTTNSGYQGNLLPVEKGDSYQIYWNSNITPTRVYWARFYYSKGNGSLYFYVGETVQNANLINAGRIEEKLVNIDVKVDGKLNSNAVKAYITQTYVNGTSGYNVYSNGYCEQWGNLVISTYNYTFLKTFKSTPNLQITRYSNANTGASVYDVVGSNAVPSTTGFKLAGANFTSNFFAGGSWKACGYIR